MGGGGWHFTAMWKQTRTSRPETEGTSQLSVITVGGLCSYIYRQEKKRQEGQKAERKLEKVYMPMWCQEHSCLSTLLVGTTQWSGICLLYKRTGFDQQHCNK